MRRVRCKLCGELTARPVYARRQATTAPGVSAPDAKVEQIRVCQSCASMLDDGEED